MKNLLVNMLITSFTISLLGLVYMGLTPYLRKKYKGKTNYIGWILLFIALLIPFRPYNDKALVKVPLTQIDRLENQVWVSNKNQSLSRETEIERVEKEPHTSAYEVSGEQKIAVKPLVQKVPSSFPQASAINQNISPTMKAPLLEKISWWQLFGSIWLAGMGIFLTYHGVKHWRFLFLVERWKKRVKDEKILAVFQALQKELNIQKKMELYICPFIGSPMMIGLFSPKILLPKKTIKKESLTLILKHELIHYKRKDLWIKTVVLLASALHWFNPVVRIMSKQLHIACEIACDEKVIGTTNENQRSDYGQAILHLMKKQPEVKTALSTNFDGGKKGMKKRLISIMDMAPKN